MGARRCPGWHVLGEQPPRACVQGLRSVDVAVLWPKGYKQFHIVRPPA